MTDSTTIADRSPAAGDDDNKVTTNGGASDGASTARGVKRSGRRFGRFEIALLAIAFVGLLGRVGYIAATTGDRTLCPVTNIYGVTEREPILCGDALYYSLQAHAIGMGDGYMLNGVQAADHAPLTALVLAPLSTVLRGTDSPVTAQRLEMALFGFATIVAIGLLGRRAGGKRGPTVGLVAAGIAAVNANFWMNDVIVMSETLATLGVALTLLAIYRFIDLPSTRRAAMVGVLVGFTGLARAELLMLAPIAFVPVVLWTRSLSWPAKLLRITVAGVCTVALLMPWTAFNMSRFEEPVLLSTNDGLTLVGANCPQVYGLTNEGIAGDNGGIGFWNLGCAFKVGDQVPPGADQSQVSKIYRQIGLDYIKEHKGRLRIVAEYRMLRGWGVFAPDQLVWLNKGEGRTPWASWLGYYQWWLLLAPAALGVRILRQRKLPVWPLASMAVVVSVTLLVFYGIIRFRIAADVAVTVLAAVAIDHCARWFKTNGGFRGAFTQLGRTWFASSAVPASPGAPVAANAPATGALVAANAPANPDSESDAGSRAPAAAGGEPTKAPANGSALASPPARASISAGPTSAGPDSAGSDSAGPVAAMTRSGAMHFPCLDAYRAIGMTMVLLNHVAYSTGSMGPDSGVPQFLIPIIARLDLSVPMFFVMSGFLLFRPFAKSILQGRELPPAGTFYRRRVLRILPAYWVAVALIGLMFGLQISGIRAWIGNTLLLPAFGIPVQVCQDGNNCHVGYTVTQVWSIGVEATFYLLLPVGAMVLHRLARGRDDKGRLVVLLAGLGALYLAGTLFRALVVGADPAWADRSLLLLPMFADLFALGMAVGVISAAASIGRPLPRLFAWFGEHPAASWAIAGAIFLVVTRMKYPTRPFGLHDADGSSDYLPRQFLYGIASVVWLAPAIFGDQTRGLIRRVLSSRPLVYLGAVSLSFYLWHLAIIDKVKAWTVPDYLGRIETAAHPPPDNPLAGVATFTGNFPKVVIVSWVLSLIVAAISYRFVELPFQRLKDEPLRALWSGRRPAGPSAGTTGAAAPASPAGGAATATGASGPDGAATAPTSAPGPQEPGPEPRRPEPTPATT